MKRSLDLFIGALLPKAQLQFPSRRRSRVSRDGDPARRRVGAHGNAPAIPFSQRERGQS